MSCCNFENDILFEKIKDLEKNVKKFEKEQNKTNAEIYTLLKESGVDLSQYYALNEEDYTKTLTSEDDINTLEPGTYKIVREDMPQNSPVGVESSEYDGTLIQSNSYAILVENGYLHIGTFFTAMNRFRWNYVINSNLINIHLQYYMLISKYSNGDFIDDIHILNQNLTGVFIVNSTTQNLPVQENGIIIVRLGTATNSLFVTFIPEDSFDVYHCAKKSDGTWTEWEQVAFLSDVPSLTGYATEEWVNQQIQDITGGNVTADWVKSNYYALTREQYTTLGKNTDYNTLKAGCYFGHASNFTNSVISSLAGDILIIKFHTSNSTYSRAIIYNFTDNRIYFCNSSATQVIQIAYSEDIPSLSGYATQAWVQSQNYLTEIPDEYTTVTEVGKAITAALVGYATQAWVSEQIQEITGGAVTSDIVSQMISDALNGYATQTWVNGRGYQNAAQVSAAITAAIAGYATEQYVNENYLAIESTRYTDILENADLNNYTTVGNYFCSTSVKAKTLKNTPKGLKYAFKLTYEEITANNQAVQKITENATGNEYLRVKVADNWGEWITRGVMSVFNTFSQLGITDLPCTTLDVYKAMPANSTAILGTDATAGISDLPTSSGTLEIIKTSSNFRYKIAFYKSSGGDVPPSKDMWLATVNTNFTKLTWEKAAFITDIPSLNGYASQEWVKQQGYQTVQQVKSLINTATADMLTQADLDTFNYATENWVVQTALAGYATQNWVSQQGFAKTVIDDSLATRPSQEFDRFMIRSTDYHGVNAVSGAEGYLVMHMAVDPDNPTKFIRSSGIVVNNTYVNTFSTSDEASVGLATNNQGTVTVVGMSNNAKQMFILVKPDNID